MTEAVPVSERRVYLMTSVDIEIANSSCPCMVTVRGVMTCSVAPYDGHDDHLSGPDLAKIEAAALAYLSERSAGRLANLDRPDRQVASDLPPEAAAVTWAWSAILRSAYDRATTAEVWAAVRAAAARSGNQLGAGAFAGVTYLRHLAVSQRRAGDDFARAADSATLAASMAPQDVSSRSLAEQAARPTLLARMTLTTETPEGDILVRPVSFDHVLTPDITVGEVRQMAYEAATGISDTYGETYVGHHITVLMSV